jgi:hypothetical protein
MHWQFAQGGAVAISTIVFSDKGDRYAGRLAIIYPLFKNL